MTLQAGHHNALCSLYVPLLQLKDVNICFQCFKINLVHVHYSMSEEVRTVFRGRFSPFGSLEIEIHRAWQQAPLYYQPCFSSLSPPPESLLNKNHICNKAFQYVKIELRYNDLGLSRKPLPQK